MMTRNTAMAVLLGIPPSIYFWPWGIVAPFLFVAWGIWHARRSYAISAWARTSFGMMYRSGVLMRCVSATFFDKVQVVSVHHSPFDRRHDMATLRVDTAGAGPAGHRIHIRYLMRSTAERLAGVLLSEIGRRPPQAVPKLRQNRFQRLAPAGAPA
jgi:putative membrane protein